MRRQRGNLGCLREFFTQTETLDLAEFPLTLSPVNGADSLTASAQWKGVHLQRIFSDFLSSSSVSLPFILAWTSV